MKKYIVVSGHYDAFSPDYDMKKEIRNAVRKRIVGFDNVRKYVGHSMTYSRNSKNWMCFCNDCKRFWIAQEEE